MLKRFGLHHPFFRPLSHRLGTLAVIILWGLVEYMLGNTGWATFSVYLVIFCALGFFIFPDPQSDKGNNG